MWRKWLKCRAWKIRRAPLFCVPGEKFTSGEFRSRFAGVLIFPVALINYGVNLNHRRADIYRFPSIFSLCIATPYKFCTYVRRYRSWWVTISSFVFRRCNWFPNPKKWVFRSFFWVTPPRQPAIIHYSAVARTVVAPATDSFFRGTQRHELANYIPVKFLSQKLFLKKVALCAKTHQTSSQVFFPVACLDRVKKEKQ